MFYLRNIHAKKPTPIVARIYLKSEKREFKHSTGISILPEHWDNESGTPIKARGLLGNDLKLIEAQLNQIQSRFTQAIQEAKFAEREINTEYLTNKLNKTAKISILTEGIDLLVSTKKASNALSPATIKKYNQVKSLIEKYQSHMGVVLTFYNINAKFQDQFLQYSYKILKHHDNTVGRNIGHIRSIVKWAYDQSLHTSEGYKDLKKFSVDSDQMALTLEEVMTLYNHQFELNKHTKAVDLFLIGVFSGQRVSDYSVFDKNDYQEGYITKRSKKTNVRGEIPVDSNPFLKSLLEKYDWDIPRISDQKLNEYIKEACKIAKINAPFKYQRSRGVEKTQIVKAKCDLVSTHTARRTFITLAIPEMGYKKVMKITGILKVETLLKYEQADRKSIDSAIKKVFPENG
ncbi:MAG: phage integrase SAM-like domain-containing protein [Reichenbachiella sp.]